MSTPSNLPLSQLSLSQWSVDSVQKALSEDPLLLHLKRVRDQESPTQKRIILLVHGLNSSAATWLTFLSQAFPLPELQPFDFGLFNYQTSLFSRLNVFQRLPQPEDWARVLASVIRNMVLTQERYDSYVLIGHSMGGLVSKFAIRYLLEDNAPAVSRLHSLFSYGTPNHGSDRANAVGAFLSPDLALLRAFSRPIQDLQTFWNTRISAVPGVAGRFTVHERAVVSVKDSWVAPSSGISSLPEEFVERLASSHSGLLQPAGPNDPRLSWFVDQLQAIQRQSECTLIAINDGPSPEDFAGDDAGEKLIQGIFQALFVLDVGTADGVAKGDKFGLYYESTEVRDSGGRVVDRIPGAMNLLGAIEVKERASYCKLESFAYQEGMKGIELAVSALESQGVQELDDKQIDKLVLTLFGRRAVRIRREESDGSGKLEEIYSRVLDEERGSAPRRKALLELLLASGDFVAAHPGSVLVDGAAFHEAWSTMELEQYEEAEQRFERFCKNYPFSKSISGARQWIAEIELRITLRDSGNAPEQQLALAEYLLKQETNADEATDEAIRLAFDALVTKPALVSRMTQSMRFVLTAQKVLHEVLGMDPEAPAAMAAFLDTYHTDPTKRAETQAAVTAKIPAERAVVLLQLLDSVGLLKMDPKPS